MNLVIMKQVSGPPTTQPYHIVEIVQTCDGARWRFTSYHSDTSEGAERLLATIPPVQDKNHDQP